MGFIKRILFEKLAKMIGHKLKCNSISKFSMYKYKQKKPRPRRFFFCVNGWINTQTNINFISRRPSLHTKFL